MALPPTPDGSSFRHDLHRAAQGIDTLKDDAGALGHEAAAAARSGLTELRHGAERARDSVATRMQNAGDRFRRQEAGAREDLASAGASLKHILVRNPMASMGVVAGIGLLLGLVMSRSR